MVVVKKHAALYQLDIIVTKRLEPLWVMGEPPVAQQRGKQAHLDGGRQSMRRCINLTFWFLCVPIFGCQEVGEESEDLPVSPRLSSNNNSSLGFGVPPNVP